MEERSKHTKDDMHKSSDEESDTKKVALRDTENVAAPNEKMKSSAPSNTSMKKTTNNMAVASMVLGIFSIIGGFILGIIPAVIAIVLGFCAKASIKKAEPAETGNGMALAGIIMGFASIGFFIITIIACILFWFYLPEFFDGLKKFFRPFE